LGTISVTPDGLINPNSTKADIALQHDAYLFYAQVVLFAQHAFPAMAPSIWNSMPADIRLCR